MKNALITTVELLQAKSKPHLCFTPDTDEDLAKRVFVSRFNVEPEHVFSDGQMLWVGPAPEETWVESGN